MCNDLVYNWRQVIAYFINDENHPRITKITSVSISPDNNVLIYPSGPYPSKKKIGMVPHSKLTVKIVLDFANTGKI